jgi:hypothetical protein
MHNIEVLWYLMLVLTAMVSTAASSQNVQPHPVYRMTENMYPVTKGCKKTCAMMAVLGGFLTSCLIYHFSCRAYTVKNIWIP